MISPTPGTTLSVATVTCIPSVGVQATVQLLYAGASLKWSKLAKLVHTMSMTENNEQIPQPVTKAEFRARIVGNSLEHDREDILFWRAASEAVRGQTLYRLRRRGKAMHSAVPHVIEENDDARRLVLTPRHVEIITVYE